MAVIQSEFSFSSSPKWKGIFEATETIRNGSSVTFKIVAKLKLDGTSSSTFYGYAVNWRATLNGVSSGLLKVKDASPRWYGGEAYRTFTTTLTTSVGASGGTIPLKIEVLPSGGGNVSLNKTYNVSYSTWNTPPTMSGSLGLSVSGTIPENTSSVKLTWSKASDSNNNANGYQIYRYANGSHNATFNVNSANTLEYADNISSFGQGTKIYYKIWAKDSYGEWSNALTSATITKNTLTGATLNISGSIGYDTKLVSFSYSGAKNTNGNTSFKYKLYSDHIKVYNHDKITGTPFNVTVWRTGDATPTTPYIKFDDIKNYAKGGSNWSRSATFMLETLNNFGSSVTTTKAVSVDIKTNPNPPSSISTSGTVSLSDNRAFYIPDKQGITVSWSGASDKLGGSLTYKVYVKIGTGSYTLLKSGVTGTSTTVSLSAVKKEETCVFKVVAVTSYGKEAELVGTSISLHYYNSPIIDFKNLNRTAEGFTVDVETKINTSITGILFPKRVYSGVMSGTLTQSPQTLSKTGLEDDASYSLTVTLLDDTGLSSEVTKTLSIPVYTPIMSVREKGVGVNVIPDGTAKLMVKGGASIEGGMIIKGNIQITSADGLYKGNLIVGKNGDANGMGIAIQGGGTTIIGGGESAVTTLNSIESPASEQMYVTSDNDVFIHTNLQSGVGAKKEFKFGKDGTLTVDGGRVYTTKYKPTASDIGASASNHTHSYLPLSGGTTNGVTTFNRGSSTQAVLVHTQGDSNGSGDGQSHLGYYNNGAYHHYLRGKGTTTIDTHGGVTISGQIRGHKNMELAHSLYMGSYEDAYRGLMVKRQTSGKNYEGRYGVSYGTIKLSSSSASAITYGAVIESHDTSTAVARYLCGNTCFTPLTDNNKQCGTSSHRWSALYASTGTVYSSSKDEKSDIVPVENKTRAYSNVPDTKDIIVDGIKGLNLYSYKYRSMGTDDLFVGFLGQELEEQNKDFFNLIGSSYTTDGGNLQYDIRETSVIGTLYVGLQEALKKNDELEERVRVLEVLVKELIKK